jgi:hypothetical protein
MVNIPAMALSSEVLDERGGPSTRYILPGDSTVVTSFSTYMRSRVRSAGPAATMMLTTLSNR